MFWWFFCNFLFTFARLNDWQCWNLIASLFFIAFLSISIDATKVSSSNKKFRDMSSNCWLGSDDGHAMGWMEVLKLKLINSCRNPRAKYLFFFSVTLAKCPSLSGSVLCSRSLARFASRPVTICTKFPFVGIMQMDWFEICCHARHGLCFSLAWHLFLYFCANNWKGKSPSNKWMDHHPADGHMKFAIQQDFVEIENFNVRNGKYFFFFLIEVSQNLFEKNLGILSTTPATFDGSNNSRRPSMWVQNFN